MSTAAHIMPNSLNPPHLKTHTRTHDVQSNLTSPHLTSPLQTRRDVLHPRDLHLRLSLRYANDGRARPSSDVPAAARGPQHARPAPTAASSLFLILAFFILRHPLRALERRCRSSSRRSGSGCGQPDARRLLARCDTGAEAPAPGQRSCSCSCEPGARGRGEAGAAHRADQSGSTRSG